MIHPEASDEAFAANDTTDFYNAVADHYRLFYRNWEATLDREGATLRRALNAAKVKTVLDTSCGTGTQAIALARLGFIVIATDINQAMIAQARINAARFKVADKIKFGHYGFLELGNAFKPGTAFDAVITKGNSLTHLLIDAEISAALHNFYQLLRPGGLLIVGIRDFDLLIDDRPRFIPGQFHDDPEDQHILFDIWDWNDGPPVTVTFNKFIVSGHDTEYTVSKNVVRYRALRRAELEAMLVEAGFIDVKIEQQRWELVFTASRPA
jgi:SAM-dependent methyltransferase